MKFYALLLATLWLTLLPQFGIAAPTATLTYPTPVNNLNYSSNFTWSPQSGASGYWLSIKDDSGNQHGDQRLYSASTSSVQVSGLPNKALNIELITVYPSSAGTNWDNRSYTRLNEPAASLAYPSAQTLDGSEQWFIWDKIAGADQYWLTVRDNDYNYYHFGYVQLDTNLAEIDQKKISGLPTDGRSIVTELITIIDGNWNRRSAKTYNSASSIVDTAAWVTDGYDWEVPANYSTNGALVDAQWNRDSDANPVRPDYAKAATYDFRWKAAYNGLVGQADPFEEFEGFLSNYSDGRKLLVRLETTSKCNVPNALNYRFNYYAGNSIAFWEEAYLTELERLVSRFGSRYANDSRIIGVHVGIADGEYKDGNGNLLYSCPDNVYSNRDGWGEMNMSEDELKSAIQMGFTPNKFDTSVRRIVDIYANAFPGNEQKLAFMSYKHFTFDDPSSTDVPSFRIKEFNDKHTQLADYALNSGLGNRDGLIENWMGYTEKVYGMTFTPSSNDQTSCNMGMDESVADQIAGRYWGTENEEYGIGWEFRYGPLTQHPYRFMISSLRALQMRRNYVTIESNGMSIYGQTPYNTSGFLEYLARTVGRTKWDTPDAFVVHGERYIRLDELEEYNVAFCASNNHAKIREFGRWLTEIEGQGYPSMPVDLTQHNAMNSMSYGLPAYPAGQYPASMQGKTRYEYQARYHNSFTYDINDQVINNRCSGNCAAEVKIVFNDTVATNLSVENQEGILNTIRTTGEGGIKTATFPVNTQFYNGFRGGDFSVTSSEKLPVLLTRVNFLNF